MTAWWALAAAYGASAAWLAWELHHAPELDPHDPAGWNDDERRRLR